MERRTPDDIDVASAPAFSAVELDRYASLGLTDGATIVYDVHNERAWVQSTSAVDLAGMA